jgi:Ni,Fe-hydrogenase III large subunit
MLAGSALLLHNGEVAAAADLPALGAVEFRRAILDEIDSGSRVAALFGTPAAGGGVLLISVLARDGEGTLALRSTKVKGSYPALTPECPQAHLFEREIAEQWGVTPEGHPWPDPVRSGAPREFFKVDGESVHEVAVGPVHAGVIEPGHFRFQCHGERVLHLEIALGYQHRGLERALRGGPDRRTIHYMETAAGDTSAGHASAYCQAVEALSGTSVPARGQALRGIALELERLANHTGDLGALAGDVAYLPAASFCGRLRGEFLNMTASACGSRLGRGFVRPGGAAFDVDAERAAVLQVRLDAAMRDLRGAADLLWDTPSVLARFEETGTLARQTCEDLGLVGPAARACGVERDVRHSYPSGIYRFAQIPVSTWETGDVFSRAYVRWLEAKRSALFVKEQLASLPGGAVRAVPGPLAPASLVVSLVEGWRGEICHAAMTDEEGRFAIYKIVDPSFHNWMGLAMAMRDEAISDFPLCNKSFNLSYCGHDL